LDRTILLNEDFEGEFLPRDGHSKRWRRMVVGSWELAGNCKAMVEHCTHGNFIATNDDGCDCDKSADYLIMPVLDLSNSEAAMLTFDAFYDGGTFEGDTEVATIEYSLDGGNTWQVLKPSREPRMENGMAHTVSSHTAIGRILMCFWPSATMTMVAGFWMCH
jgi:hypothetical protein